MKLSLRHEDSVAILEVSGTVDTHNFQVLKAGLTKLLRDGKNRIILSFTDAQELESDVLRELAIVDVFARELSGKIILAAESEELREGVKIFAKPPVIPILSSVALALDYFKKSEPVEEEESDPEVLRAALQAKDQEIAALQARLKQLDPKESNELRAVNASLKTKLSLLEQQVEDLTKEKRIPVDAEGFLEKITALEESLKRMQPGKA
jgi:anti-anti-sigma regulatory factor